MLLKESEDSVLFSSLPSIPASGSGSCAGSGISFFSACSVVLPSSCDSMESSSPDKDFSGFGCGGVILSKLESEDELSELLLRDGALSDSDIQLQS